MQRKNPGFEDVTKKFRKRGILLDLRFSPGSRERQALLALHTDLFWRGLLQTERKARRNRGNDVA